MPKTLIEKLRTLTPEKLRRRLWSTIVRRMRRTPLYPFIYRSYWHYLMHKSVSSGDMSGLCYTARPNPGAGIGHQMANWIAGLWWARQFGLQFVHYPFSSPSWEHFLGFGGGINR